MTTELTSLKLSLQTALEQWVEKAGAEDHWMALDTYVGHKAVELMADSAFNILLAQKDLTNYLRKEDAQP